MLVVLSLSNMVIMEKGNQEGERDRLLMYSHNVRGMTSKLKRDRLLQYSLNKHMSIPFLQETYTTIGAMLTHKEFEIGS